MKFGAGMKKYLVIFILAGTFAAPHEAQAGGKAADAVASAALTALIYGQQLLDSKTFTKQITNLIEAVTTARDNLKKVEDTCDYFVNQLRKFGNIKDYKDFMRWSDRSLYLAERVERDFSNINVKVGNKIYYLREAVEIKESLENGENDIRDGDMTESERIRVYRKLGLSPSSYRYLKTWEGRVDAAVKESSVSKDLINEEAGKTEEEQKEDMRIVESEKELTETQRWQLNMRMLDRRVKQLMLMNEQMARRNDMAAARIKKEETKELPRGMKAGSGYRRANNNFDL
jgi:hypothetical protein